MSSRVSLGREVAYDAFIEVMDHHRKPEAALSYYYNKHGDNIRKIDKNFVKELVYGSLRWHSKMFWILQNTSNRDLTKVSPQIRSALVVGTYQIYYMDRVPDRSAVNESVEYVRKRGQSNACSFVNGILRQIARRAEYFAKPDKEKEPAGYLAMQYAHPKWIIERWLAQFDFTRVEKIAAANNKVPPIFVRVNSMRGLPAYKLQSQLLKDEHIHSERRPLRCSLHLKTFPELGEGSLFSQGYYTFQDEAAQLISFLVQPQKDESIIDLCTGKGGKLTHMYELSNGEANITAVDKNSKYLQIARENAVRMGHEGITYVHADVMAWDFDGKVDKILLDAPCSCLGILRRHPEAKWHKKNTIVSDTEQLQRRLIMQAVNWLKDGGELIYSVCSFEAEETLNLLEFCKRKFSERLKVISPVSRIPDYYKQYVTRKNILQIYSGNNDLIDGFSAFIIKVDG